MRRAALLLLPALLVTSCAHESVSRRQEVRAIARAHELELAEQEHARAAFAAAHGARRELVFPEAGTLDVLECELQGRLGREEVRLRFVWTNTTGRRIDAVRVSMSLLDGAQRVRRREEVLLDLPLGYRFIPDASYTASLLVPTEGLHLEPGWTLAIDASADFSEPAVPHAGRGR